MPVHDNCRYVPNPDQRDTNGDGRGDLCQGLPSRSGQRRGWRQDLRFRRAGREPLQVGQLPARAEWRRHRDRPGELQRGGGGREEARQRELRGAWRRVRPGALPAYARCRDSRGALRPRRRTPAVRWVLLRSSDIGGYRIHACGPARLGTGRLNVGGETAAEYADVRAVLSGECRALLRLPRGSEHPR